MPCRDVKVDVDAEVEVTCQHAPRHARSIMDCQSKFEFLGPAAAPPRCRVQRSAAQYGGTMPQGVTRWIG
jgi:hypothetical protein